MTLPTRQSGPHDPTRNRFIRETEVALFIGLRFPELFERIPVVEVERGEFSRRFAHEYWCDVLGVGYPAKSLR